MAKDDREFVLILPNPYAGILYGPTNRPLPPISFDTTPIFCVTAWVVLDLTHIYPVFCFQPKNWQARCRRKSKCQLRSPSLLILT
jgi:hypothetical protein